jgi:hypothetical protein
MGGPKSVHLDKFYCIAFTKGLIEHKGRDRRLAVGCLLGSMAHMPSYLSSTRHTQQVIMACKVPAHNKGFFGPRLYMVDNACEWGVVWNEDPSVIMQPPRSRSLSHVKCQEFFWVLDRYWSWRVPLDFMVGCCWLECTCHEEPHRKVARVFTWKGEPTHLPP